MERGRLHLRELHPLARRVEGRRAAASWKEVFDIGRLEFFDDPVYQVLERGADRITIYRDPDRLEAELLARAPEDAGAVREFAGLVRKFTRFRMPEGDSLLRNVGAYVGLVPYVPALSRYGKLTMADYSRRFTNPLLRRFFTAGVGDLSLLAIVLSLAWMAQGDAGYPIGGSLRMIGLIEDNYRELGGRIRFRARVERILVEEGRAVGVVLHGGEELRADVVVFPGRRPRHDLRHAGGLVHRREDPEGLRDVQALPLLRPVSLGVDADLAGEPGLVLLLLRLAAAPVAEGWKAAEPTFVASTSALMSG